MRLDAAQREFYMTIGYKLSRLEFLWRSPLDDAKAALEPAKRELMSLLQDEGIRVGAADDFDAFASPILNYFRNTSNEKYSCILVGSSAQRVSILGLSPQLDESIIELARRVLDGIPPVIYSDKDKLFSLIKDGKYNDLAQLVVLLDAAFETPGPAF